MFKVNAYSVLYEDQLFIFVHKTMYVTMVTVRRNFLQVDEKKKKKK